MSWLVLPVLYLSTAAVGILSGYVAHNALELRDLRRANRGDRIRS